MQIAFYAPLKPPDHPVPSGDRRMARLLVAALQRAGHTVEVASRLRARVGDGDARRQQAIANRGAATAERLIRRYTAGKPEARPAAWFTYHLYYKAPDWIGPAVCDALALPYLVAEASHAGKRAAGAWARGHAAAAQAIRRADAIFTINPADAEGLLPLVTAPSRLVALTPFIEDAALAAPDIARAALRADLAARLQLDPAAAWLLAVGMMREGDKLASYRLLGEALARLAGRQDWQLIAVGDGPARAAVEAALAPLAPRLRLLGALPPEALKPLYAAADLFVWPAVNEAYGMALLEAQALALPAVAGDFGGVGAILEHGSTGVLTAPGDGGAFAAAVARLLDEPQTRAAMGKAARTKVLAQHRIASAAKAIDAALGRVVAARAAAAREKCRA